MLYKKITISLILGMLLACFGCNRSAAPASGTSYKPEKREHADSFSGKKRKSIKAPQMGFYAKKNKESIFSKISYKVKHTFASDKKRHVLDNDRRATSQKNQQRRESESLGNSGFVEGKHKAKKSSNKKGDNTSDSFSKDPNKKSGGSKRKKL